MSMYVYGLVRFVYGVRCTGSCIFKSPLYEWPCVDDTIEDGNPGLRLYTQFRPKVFLIREN